MKGVIMIEPILDYVVRCNTLVFNYKLTYHKKLLYLFYTVSGNHKISIIVHYKTWKPKHLLFISKISKEALSNPPPFLKIEIKL